MKMRWISGLGVAAVILLGLAAAAHLQKRIDAERQAIHEERDEMVLRSPSLIKKLSLEYAPLMGAVYWTRAVQYYGQKHHLHDPKLDLLWPLLDVATTLDPKLLVAYRFGSTFLSDAPPRGAARPDLAAALLQRGLKVNPDQWRLYQDLGNVYYFDAKDYPKAAWAFEEGSKNPKAPIWMKVMAAKIAATGESLETSYTLWAEVLQGATDPAIRQNAESHLRVVKSQLDRREIDKLADQYAEKFGHRPARISDLLQAGFLPGTPADPAGFPYILGQDGEAQLHPNSPMLKEEAAKK